MMAKEDFSIKRILGIDFLQTHQAKCDLGKKQIRIGNGTFKLQPYVKIILKLRNKTISQAITNSIRVGIVNTKKTMPRVFIRNCLIKSKRSTCLI